MPRYYSVIFERVYYKYKSYRFYMLKRNKKLLNYSCIYIGISNTRIMHLDMFKMKQISKQKNILIINDKNNTHKVI